MIEEVEEQKETDFVYLQKQRLPQDNQIEEEKIKEVEKEIEETKHSKDQEIYVEEKYSSDFEEKTRIEPEEHLRVVIDKVNSLLSRSKIKNNFYQQVHLRNLEIYKEQRRGDLTEWK